MCSQLMAMMRTARRTASTRQHGKSLAEDVAYAIKQEQFGFERFIPETHYPILAEVCLSKNVTQDETGQLMLFNTSVLEYNGDNHWNSPNPLVKRSDAFKAALRDTLKNTNESGDAEPDTGNDSPDAE